ncbi:unnamed protein product [Penicillium bialowiezense]
MGLFKHRKRPRQMYGYGYQKLTNGAYYIGRDSAINVIMADYALREQVQREETMSYRLTASRKAAVIECDQPQADDSEISKRSRKELSEKERALYEAVSLLDQRTKDAYDAQRCDPVWSVPIKVDAVADNVDAALQDTLLESQKASVIALQNAGAVSTFAAPIYQRTRKGRLGGIWSSDFSNPMRSVGISRLIFCGSPLGFSIHPSRGFDISV